MEAADGFTKPEVKTAFCNLLESYVHEYNMAIVGEFNYRLIVLGVGVLTLIIVSFYYLLA